MTKELPSPELLRKLLRYEPDTGRLFWRERTPDMFWDGKQTAEHRCANWNARYAGQEAFTSDSGHGYRKGGVFLRSEYAHRVAWAIYHGKWPSGEIDHINGDKADNRIQNMRDVDRSTNSRNTSMSAKNKSGFTGVRWHLPTNKWIAEIGLNGKTKHLGLFNSIEGAIAARRCAEIKHGFTERHGK